MENFDFGQFQQVFEYLMEKLAAGGALTPEEQQTYDILVSIANQGLDLTGTKDFNSLYTAFNALADEGTKKEFSKLYGENLFRDPSSGAIQFTRPGSLIEQFMRRGLSVNDGPVVAALSEGLSEYMRTIAQNKFAAMTNAYSAMTPIRAQNIQAATNAGGIAGGAAQRRVPIAGVANSVAGGGAGEAGGGEPITIDTGGAGSPDKPGFMDKYGSALLLGLLGPAALGIGGYLLKDWWQGKDKKPQALGEEDLIDRNAPERAPGDDFAWLAKAQAAPSIGPYEMMGADTYGAGFNPFAQANMGAFRGADQYDWSPQQQQPMFTDQVQWSPGAGPQDQGWTQPGDWPAVDNGQTWDSSYYTPQTYDPYSWSGDQSSGYWV